MNLQTMSNELAQNGKQYEARQALESAYNYSVADPALNEDARVQLRKLIRQQAVVGLVGRRGQIRMQTGGQAEEAGKNLGDRFNRDEAERLESSLSQDDTGNLNRIADRLIEMQERAAGTSLQLVINMPLKGKVLEFTRPLQVKPNSPMLVTFCAKRLPERDARSNWVVAAGLGLGLFLVLSLCVVVKEKRRSVPPAAEPVPPQEPPVIEASMGEPADDFGDADLSDPDDAEEAPAADEEEDGQPHDETPNADENAGDQGEDQDDAAR